jgi:phospholipase A1
MGWTVLGAVMTSGGAWAQQVPVELEPQEAIDACRALEEPLRRLACYDTIPGADVTGEEDLAEIVEEPSTDRELVLLEVEPEAVKKDEVPIARSRMMRHWELDSATHGGLLRVRRHEPVYVLPARWSSNPNDRPETPTLAVPSNSIELDSIEAKFQLSLKTKLVDNLFDGNGDLWIGYTQQSNWQAYNSVESEPFRETNYAPEIFTAWRTGLDLPLGWRWQMVNLGFVHQSNGRTEPLSRSWNRVYAQFGLERGDWQLYLRPWLRVEEGSDDDNPDIEDYLGHGDLRLLWRKGGHDLGLTTRWSPSDNRGALQLDWHYPLKGDLKAYLQLFHGYGETLIDYNHRQTAIGLGVSLVQ